MTQVYSSQELAIPSGLANLLVAHAGGLGQMAVVEHLGVVGHLVVFVRLEGRVNDFWRGESFFTTI
jgi:hypothetical protein